MMMVWELRGSDQWNAGSQKLACVLVGRRNTGGCIESQDNKLMMKILFLCLMLSFEWWVLMRWCVPGSGFIEGWLRQWWSFGTSFVWELQKLLTKILPSAGRKDSGKCVEGKRKSTTMSWQWRSSFLPNNGTAGDLLECNCCCYLCNANNQEMMGPGGHSPRSRTFHYGRTTDRHLRQIVKKMVIYH
jgi:hypothetical protein